MDKKSENIISKVYHGYDKYVPSPILSALLAGALTYGGTKLAYPQLLSTVHSLGRHTFAPMVGMPAEAWDEAFMEMAQEPALAKWLPVVAAATLGGGIMANAYDPYREYGGLLYKNAPQRYYKPDSSWKYSDRHSFPGYSGITKTQSLRKQADNMFEYGGYVPEMDFSSVINARDAKSLFTNDPYLQNNDYARNMGTAIVSNAALNAGSNNVTLGGVFDSAVNKISNKLSFEGVTSVAVKTLVSNGIARLLTGAIGTMTNLSPDVRNTIVEAGTWAGAVSSILK